MQDIRSLTSQSARVHYPTFSIYYLLNTVDGGCTLLLWDKVETNNKNLRENFLGSKIRKKKLVRYLFVIFVKFMSNLIKLTCSYRQETLRSRLADHLGSSSRHQIWRKFSGTLWNHYLKCLEKLTHDLKNEFDPKVLQVVSLTFP